MSSSTNPSTVPSLDLTPAPQPDATPDPTRQNPTQSDTSTPPTPDPLPTIQQNPTESDIQITPTQQNPTEPDTQTPAPPTSTQHNPTESDTKNPDPPLLTGRQQTAITLLLGGHTITAVAAVLGLHRSTLYEWKRQTPFISELHRRQHEIRRAADARLRLLMLQATQTALDSLHKKRPDRHQSALRLLTVLRPFLPILNQPEPPFPPDDEIVRLNTQGEPL